VIDVGSIVNGKYRLARLLGDGGMGSVYEAHHAVLGNRVAIKVLHPELARRTGLVDRFLQEARLAAQIRSPHIVQVIDVDRTPDGHAYIVMELLEGEPLSSVLERQRKLSIAVACEYTTQVLEALEAAHALGVIHRDLKPENVFVTFAGGKPVVKLIDFGIAKARRNDPQNKNLTVAGIVMGTAEYMAPEQARSADKVDARADIYAVGVLLYEMIAGARPIDGDDARVIALKVERGEVVPLVRAAPEVPREIAGLVHRAMAPRPELRFATATEMRLALQSAMDGKRPATASMAAAPANVAGPSRTVQLPSAGLHNGRGATSAEAEPPVDTVRSPPVATALAPPFGAAGPPPRPEERARRRRRGPLIALVMVPVLLGAAIVGVLVATGTWAGGTGAEPPPATIESPGSAAAPATSASPTQSASRPAPEVPTLVPAKPSPGPPRPQPSAHGQPASAADAGFSPFVFPSTFPSTLPPFPSGFSLPAGFPTSFPSGFPSVLPPWPPPLQEPPAPASAAPGNPPG
jgi:tRNA A-37 threonylcarbamoyl transferase component Bud32